MTGPKLRPQDCRLVRIRAVSAPKKRWPLLSLLPPTPFLPFSCPCSGQLSLSEFIEGARRDKWVMKMLQMDVNPGGWISQQRRKSAMF